MVDPRIQITRRKTRKPAKTVRKGGLWPLSPASTSLVLLMNSLLEDSGLDALARNEANFLSDLRLPLNL